MTKGMAALAAAAVLMTACGAKEEAVADTAQAPMAEVAAAAPALTVEALAGTFAGKTMAADKDSVILEWVSVANADGTGVLTPTKGEAVKYSTMVEGDSMIVSSSPYTDVTLPAGTPKVVFTAYGHQSGDTLSGTAKLAFASKPDSVIGTSRWMSVRKP